MSPPVGARAVQSLSHCGESTYRGLGQRGCSSETHTAYPTLRPSGLRPIMYMEMYIGGLMAKRHSIAEARSNLPSLVREAEAGKAVELTRRGEPVAVLVGRREYEQLTSSHRRFSETYGDFVREFDLRELAIGPEEVFAPVRDDTRGREVVL